MPDSTRKTDEELKSLLELEANASGPRWACSDRGDGSGSIQVDPYDVNGISILDDGRCPFMRGEVRYEDGLLAVASRNSLRDIILDLQASRERERGLVETLKEMCSRHPRGEYEQSPYDAGYSRGLADALARAEAKEKQP